MAERLDEYDFDVSNIKTKYPWKEWTDGKIWKAKAGKDYTCRPESFRAALTKQAGERGLEVRARAEKDSMVFQFYPPARDDVSDLEPGGMT